MSLTELNWGTFLVLCLAIAGTRWLFRGLLPLDLLSISTPVTAGFVMFLSLGILGYSDLLLVPVTNFSISVWVAFLSFMVGAALIGSRKGVSRLIAQYPPPKWRMARWALVLSAIYVLVEFISFMFAGGFANISNVVFGGTAHLDYVARIGEATFNVQGQTLSDIVRIFVSYIFVSLWVIAFARAPRMAMLIYVLHIVPTLGQYFSRSGLLSMLTVPYLAYLVFYRPSRRWLVTQFAIGVIVVIIFFSWNASTRLGQNYAVTLDTVVADTIRDAGNSVIPASKILRVDLRGNTEDYLTSMVTFIIPRAIWPNKPILLYNYDISYLMTGSLVGQGTSVITSTMLGEAWYYFGWIGTILLMFMFGVTAQVLERFLTRDLLTLGIYFIVWFNSFVLIRSTFLTYFQGGIIAILLGAVMLWFVRIAFTKSWAWRSGRLVSNKVSSDE